MQSIKEMIVWDHSKENIIEKRADRIRFEKDKKEFK